MNERELYAECEPFANGKGWWHVPGCPHVDWGEDAEFIAAVREERGE